MKNRWWIYQRERFPLLAHGLLIAAFSSSAVCFSSLLRGNAALPALGSLAVAFVTCLLFFLQLRIADEFKDFEEDSQYRPYRPVPRGLVKLRELGIIFVLAALVQALLALLLEPRLLIVLVVAWIYLGLMSVEFFARDWLVARPITYLWTHMLIMPLVDFYATACDWLLEDISRPPSGLGWFLAASFFNGCVIEIGRKIRQPSDEEAGVRTYSKLWGQSRARWVWLILVLVTGVCASLAAFQIGFLVPVALGLLIIWVVAVVISKNPKRIELVSGLWTIALYLLLGLVPILIK
ncbi:MAG: UbiA family prenyltransferase [Verrucomicrobiota bacterium]